MKLGVRDVSMKSIFRNFFFCLFCLILCCSCSKSSKPYVVAIDPTWFPLDLVNKEPYMVAFSKELLIEIAKQEKIQIETIPVNWDVLLDGLNQRKYDAILASLEPYNFNTEKYDFSTNYFDLGPVLVLRDQTRFSEGEERLTDMQIAVTTDSDELTLNENFPEALIRRYNSASKALLDLANGQIEGVFVDYLLAYVFVSDIYRGVLKIVTEPYTNKGLKLVCLKKQNHRLITCFDKGLKKIKKSSDYEALMRKWKLGD